MPNAWDNLPNGKLIDTVIHGLPVRIYPDWYPFGMHAWTTADKAAYERVLAQGRGEVWSKLWTYTAKLSSPMLHEHNRVFDTCHALVAWDDCGHILDLPIDAVRLLAASGHDAAVLLYPAVFSRHKNKE